MLVFDVSKGYSRGDHTDKQFLTGFLHDREFRILASHCLGTAGFLAREEASRYKKIEEGTGAWKYQKTTTGKKGSWLPGQGILATRCLRAAGSLPREGASKYKKIEEGTEACEFQSSTGKKVSWLPAHVMCRPGA